MSDVASPDLERMPSLMRSSTFGSDCTIDTLSSVELQTPTDTPASSLEHLLGQGNGHTLKATEDTMATPRPADAEFAGDPTIGTLSSSGSLTRMAKKVKHIASKTRRMSDSFRRLRGRLSIPRKTSISASPLMASTVPGDWVDDETATIPSIVIVGADDDSLYECAGPSLSQSSTRGLYSLDDSDSDLADSTDSLYSLTCISLEVPRPAFRLPTRTALLPTFLRVLLFVPWCVAVGGALLLFPAHLDAVAFRPGYFARPAGLRRYAHWAEYARMHALMFVACAAPLVRAAPVLGALALARFAWVWGAYAGPVVSRARLGDDDMQTLAWLAKGVDVIVESAEVETDDEEEGEGEEAGEEECAED